MSESKRLVASLRINQNVISAIATFYKLFVYSILHSYFYIYSVSYTKELY